MPTDEPQSIDVASIERELTVLWKEADEGEGSSPVVRACSLNLIVLGGDDPAATHILDLLSTDHPARTFLISATGDYPAGAIESWVAAKCTIPLPGEKQVCSEQIHLKAGIEAAGRIPSVVASLLVPDIPVVLWHRGTGAVPPELFEALQELGDFTILDSAGDGDLDRSMALLGSDDSARFGDLAWERGQAWRTLLAQVFDPPPERELLERLTRIRVRYASGPEPPGDGFPSALLLGGWLLRALNQSGERTPRAEHDAATSRKLTIHGKTFHLDITDDHDAAAGINPIRSLVLESGDSSIKLSVNDQENCFRYVRRDSDGTEQERTIPQRGPSDAEMLSRLLTVLDSDPVYRQSLMLLAGLLQRRS